MKAKRIISLVLFAALTTAAQSQTTFAQRQQQTNSPNVGLKAFLEGGYAFGESIYSEVPISLLATVGYQINQHFFVGVGSGENFFSSSGVYGIPFYGDVRINLQDKSISPYIDARVGYSIVDINGLYVSPSVGCRFGTTINTAFTVGIGYEMQKTGSSILRSNGYKSVKTLGGMNVKFGFEF